jgi:hypothetical protein
MEDYKHLTNEEADNIIKDVIKEAFKVKPDREFVLYGVGAAGIREFDKAVTRYISGVDPITSNEGSKAAVTEVITTKNGNKFLRYRK